MRAKLYENKLSFKKTDTLKLFNKADSSYQIAINILEEIIPKPDAIIKTLQDSSIFATLASYIYGYGKMLFNQKKYEDAKYQHKCALEIRKAILDPEHKDVVNSLKYVGYSMYYLGELDSAKGLLKSGAQIAKNKYPEIYNEINSNLKFLQSR